MNAICVFSDALPTFINTPSRAKRFSFSELLQLLLTFSFMQLPSRLPGKGRGKAALSPETVPGAQRTRRDLAGMICIQFGNCNGGSTLGALTCLLFDNFPGMKLRGMKSELLRHKTFRDVSKRAELIS